MTETQKTRRIADLNDLVRTTMGAFGNGRLFQTMGIEALDRPVQSRIREAVELFDAFTPENDPYGQRDFGKVTVGEVDVFWKIDYYDRSLEYGSEAPENPAVTTRVLTIMRAEEY